MIGEYAAPTELGQLPDSSATETGHRHRTFRHRVVLRLPLLLCHTDFGNERGGEIGLFGYSHNANDSRVTSALTPGRGRIIRRVLSQAMCWVVVRLTANDTESVAAMRIEKLSAM